jgi:flagellar hook-associated protein 2
MTESTLVSFDATDMSAGDTLTIGGLTLTATGTLTQAEVVAAFSSLSSGATSGNAISKGTWSGTLTGFNSSIATGNTITFTSTTADTNVTDLAISATQETAGNTIAVPDTYTLTINIGGEAYDLEMSSGTTLSQLSDMINDKTGGKITASLLNVGGTNPYKLIIKSNEVGASNAITFGSTSISALKNLGLDTDSLSATNGNHLQNATDASFTYNGVAITRTSNSITDLVNGATITLNEKQTDTATQTNLSITQDLSGIKDKMSTLVTAYNDLMTSLKTATKYDITTKEAGIFQSTSQIKNLSSAINRQLLSQDEKGRSLIDYGITLDSTGTLSFDSTTFDTKVSSSTTDLEDFFRGSTTYLPTNYTSKAISANALTIASGEFQINGINIIFNTTGTDAQSNALALKNAINAAGITGVLASIGSDNNIKLSSASGYDIAITGDSAQLTLLGFSESTTYGKSTTRDGYFTKFDDLLKQYVDGTDSIFGLFSKQLDTEKTSLTAQRVKSVTTLDKKYEAMATKFAAYDLIISQLNTQFETLSQQIKASYNGTNS